MTRGAQVRRWFARATRAERITTAVAIALAASLLAASIALRPDADDTVAAGLAVDDAPGVLATVPGLTDPTATSTLDGTGATAGPSVTGGATTTATGGTAATADVVRTASDRGISSDVIKIGFMLDNTAGLNGAGFSTAQRTDGRRYIEAIAAWANRNGGVAGRRLVPVTRLTDPTNVEDQAAACRAMVDDAKVFGVVDVATMLDTAALDCIVNRQLGDTPMVHSALWSTQWQARSGGNEVSYQAAIDRISITWARDLADMGWFPRGARIGILGDNCPATRPTIVNVLAPALRARGAGEVVVGTHDCNIGAVVSQPPSIVTQFRLANVTHVLMVSNFVTAQLFTTTAASQGYTPKYSVSDWFLNTSDAVVANFEPNQFDGAIGIGSLGTMLHDSGKEPYQGWETCSVIAVEAGLQPIRPGDQASEEILHLCDNFLLMRAAIERAGPNPTRAGWRAAIQTLGTRQSAIFGPSTFGPGKFSGSDFVHTLQWRRGCKCWRSISDFRPAAA